MRVTTRTQSVLMKLANTRMIPHTHGCRISMITSTRVNILATPPLCNGGVCILHDIQYGDPWRGTSCQSWQVPYHQNESSHWLGSQSASAGTILRLILSRHFNSSNALPGQSYWYEKILQSPPRQWCTAGPMLLRTWGKLMTRTRSQG
jgi:hypothetical protein